MSATRTLMRGGFIQLLPAETGREYRRTLNGRLGQMYLPPPRCLGLLLLLVACSGAAFSRQPPGPTCSPEYPPLPTLDELPPPTETPDRMDGAIQLGLWIAGADVEVHEESPDIVNLEDTGMPVLGALSAVSFSFSPGKERAKLWWRSSYSLEWWGVHTSGTDTVPGSGFDFDGITFSPGDRVRTTFDLDFWRLSIEKSVIDSEPFTFRAAMDIELVSLSSKVTKRDGGGSGKFSEQVPVFGVSLETRFLIYRPLYGHICLSGLSWSSMFDFETDFYQVGGEFTNMRIGLVWEPAQQVTVGMEYRKFVTAFGSSDRGVNVRLQGVFLFASVRW